MVAATVATKPLVYLGLVAVLAACSSPFGPDTGGSSRVDGFATAMSRGLEMDYAPIESPKDAVARSDLIVVGRIESVAEGLTVTSPAEGGAVVFQMATLLVQVEKMVSGDPGSVDDGRIVVQAFRSPVEPLAAIQAVVPNERALLVLSDITNWSPFPGAVFEYPSGLAAGSRLYFPFVDGLWFETPNGPRAVYLGDQGAERTWMSGRSFGQAIDELGSAAGS